MVVKCYKVLDKAFCLGGVFPPKKKCDPAKPIPLANLVLVLVKNVESEERPPYWQPFYESLKGLKARRRFFFGGGEVG